MGKENIRRLLEEVRCLEQSDENKKRKSMWKELPRTARDQWRGLPKNDRSWKEGVIPVTVDLQNTFWAKYLNFNLADYYYEAETFVESYLRITIERFKMIEDDTFIEKRIPIWGGCGYEGSMFGMHVHCLPDKDPWLDHEPIIKEYDDLKNIKMPDFRTSGLMPVQIKLYEDTLSLVEDDFEVLFPEWIRSPFGVAVYIRGFENMLVDMMIAPEFAKALLEFITEARIKWYEDLSVYLGEPIRKGNLFNDEVNCPSVSDSLYRELILPFERKLSEFHGGLLYWHSCGDVTKLLDHIGTIPNIDMMHVGPWTSVDKACKVFKDKMPLEIHVNPQKDVLEADKTHMNDKIVSIINDCSNHDICGFALRLSGIGVYETLKDTVEKISTWNRIAKGTVGRVRQGNFL